MVDDDSDGSASGVAENDYFGGTEKTNVVGRRSFSDVE